MAYRTRIFFVYFALLTITAAYLAAFPVTLLHVIAESIEAFIDLCA